jgi:hypothetical protein
MPSTFLQTSAAELEEVRAFLAAAFQTRGGEPLIDRSQMHWKLYERRPDWPGSRSYVLMDNDGSIVAHATVCPVTFLTSAGRVTSVNPLDWGASRVGSGVHLLLKLHALSDTVLGVDGAPATQQILAKLAYRVVGRMELYSRVVRPWDALRHRGRGRPLRQAARFVRDCGRAWRRPYRVPSGWAVVETSRFDRSITKVLPRAGFKAFTPTERSAELLNYMLRCPIAKCAGFLVCRGSEVKGYVLLSRVGMEARIADIHVDSEETADWKIAFALAVAAARREPGVCEVIAGAAVPFIRRAILANNFSPIGQGSIFLHDPGKALVNGPPVNLNLIDGDMAYL